MGVRVVLGKPVIFAVFLFLITVSPVFAGLFDKLTASEELPHITYLSPSTVLNDRQTLVTFSGTFSPSALLKAYTANGEFIAYIGHDRFVESSANVKILQFQPQTPPGMYDFSIVEQDGRESPERFRLVVQSNNIPDVSIPPNQQPIPLPRPTPQPVPQPVPVPPTTPCSLTSIDWDRSTAQTGDTVVITLNARGSCTEPVPITIIEEDMFTDTTIKTELLTVQGNQGTISFTLDANLLDPLFDDFLEGNELELRVIARQVSSSAMLNKITAQATQETAQLSLFKELLGSKETPKNIQSIPNTPLIPLLRSNVLIVTKGDSAQGSSTNWIMITEKAGKTTKNYPVQIGRMFVKGEIQNYPVVSINNKQVKTQADVKTRWDDGSVQHAIMTFYIPELKANQAITATFGNQQTGNNNRFLGKQDMLSNRFNFDAGIALTNNAKTQKSSARTMLSNNDFTYWLQGTEATSIVLTDHTTSRKYDLGFDQYKSFRPIAHATFFPRTNQVRVRYIGEVSNTEALQDMQYDVSLTKGDQSPQQIYTKKNVYQHGATRWTKEFWLGNEPSEIAIDHNLAYLKETKFFSNYDTSITVPEAQIAKEYSDWQKKKRDILEQGWYTKKMGTPGGRREIGPWPEWSVYWLYTGDNRMKEIALGQADLAAVFPMHFREGKAGKIFKRGSNIDALGKVISPAARPTLSLSTGNDRIKNKGKDNLSLVGTFTDRGWVPDCSHQPETYSTQYVLTGDYWYLEQLYFWTSWASFHSLPQSMANGRGPTGKEGGFKDDTRGRAWCLRTRGRTAFLAPDNSPEKAHFTQLLNDLIASWEGAFNIKGTAFENTVMWKWGNTVLQKGNGSADENERGWWGDYGGRTRDPPPLGIFEKGLDQIDRNKVKPNNLVTLPWQHNFIIYSLGHLKELGFSTDALLDRTAQFLIGQVTDPNYDPYLVGQYYAATLSKTKDANFYTSFKEIKNEFLPSTLTNAKNYFKGWLKDPSGGYSYVALAAASFVTNKQKGQQTWDFLKREVYETATGQQQLKANPKWAILPRGATSSSPTITSLKPTTINNDVKNTVTINGQRFKKGVGVKITVGQQSVRYPENLVSYVNTNTATFEVLADTPQGIYEISVINPDNTESNKLPLTIQKVGGQKNQPKIIDLVPKKINAKQANIVQVIGANFLQPTLLFIEGVPLIDSRFYLYVNPTTLLIRVPKNVPTGEYNLQVLTPYGLSNRYSLKISNAFIDSHKIPIIDQVTPSTIPTGKDNQLVHVYGKHFDGVIGIKVGGQFFYPTYIYGRIDDTHYIFVVPGDVPAGKYELRLVTSDFKHSKPFTLTVA